MYYEGTKMQCISIELKYNKLCIKLLCITKEINVLYY